MRLERMKVYCADWSIFFQNHSGPNVVLLQLSARKVVEVQGADRGGDEHIAHVLSVVQHSLRVGQQSASGFLAYLGAT